MVLRGVWAGREEAITRRWEAVIKGLGRGSASFAVLYTGRKAVA